MKSIIRTLLLSGLLFAGCSSDKQETAFDQKHTGYAKVLSEFVKGESVDYLALKDNRADLDAFIDELAGLSLETYDKMTDEERMAMWINAYNGIVLRSVIDAYPIASIKDIEGAGNTKRWSVAGKKVTLDEIEHDILRQDFEDCRIHFALNCAAAGCPALYPEPFLPRQLDRQLDDAVSVFVNNPSRNSINPHNYSITTSEIFKWYLEDFQPDYQMDKFTMDNPAEGAILNFIFSHVDESVLEFIDESEDWTIEYAPFDWSLNDVKR